MKQVLLLCACAAGLLAAGCVRPPSKLVGRTPPAPVARPDVVELRSLPTAINWDEQPGADGLEVEVNFYLQRQMLPVTVKGKLDFLLFEGRLAEESASAAKPFRVWSFAPQDLRRCLRRGMAGWGYAMRLAWADKPPSGTVVTVVARYEGPDGPPLYSTPVSVATRQK